MDRTSSGRLDHQKGRGDDLCPGYDIAACQRCAVFSIIVFFQEREVKLPLRLIENDACAGGEVQASVSACHRDCEKSVGPLFPEFSWEASRFRSKNQKRIVLIGRFGVDFFPFARKK